MQTKIKLSRLEKPLKLKFSKPVKGSKPVRVVKNLTQMSDAQTVETAETVEEMVIDINPGTIRHVLRGVKIEKLEPTNTNAVKYRLLRQFYPQFIVNLKDTAELIHPEHDKLTLPAGVWAVHVVLEYDPFEEAIQAVFD